MGTRFFGALVTTLLVVVLAIYFMADLPRLRRAIVRLFPKRHRPRVAHATTVMIDKVGAYMIGNLIISLIAGVSAFIVMVILRVPFALPLAVAVAITDLIPLIGATIGAAICVLVAFATTDLWPNTIVLIIFFLVYQQFENYFIQPRVMRNAVDLSLRGRAPGRVDRCEHARRDRSADGDSGRRRRPRGRGPDAGRARRGPPRRHHRKAAPIPRPRRSRSERARLARALQAARARRWHRRP